MNNLSGSTKQNSLLDVALIVSSIVVVLTNGDTALIQSNTINSYVNYIVFALIVFSVAYSVTKQTLTTAESWRSWQSGRLSNLIGRIRTSNFMAPLFAVLSQGILMLSIVALATFVFLNLNLLELYPVSKWTIVLVFSIQGIMTGFEAESERNLIIGKKRLKSEDFDKSFSSILPISLFLLFVLCPLELLYNLSIFESKGLVWLLAFGVAFAVFLRCFRTLVRLSNRVTDVGFRSGANGRVAGYVLTIVVAQSLTTWDLLLTSELKRLAGTYFDSTFLVLFSGVALIRTLGLFNLNLSVLERLLTAVVMFVFIAGKIRYVAQM